ncbi:hypothetical protein HMN09_00814900 [Mycena chlorophos]|uniref:Glycosyltransferase family 1 protein n=1 Tax=Mycena chlorophos TaxID=658473 RepID=A0A8H6ST36_MYCCL|nr:hypothetical protein HMN09_00814900 [Mycena chlorophos]
MPRHHIVALLPPFWGHCVSYIHLAVQLLAEDPTLAISIVQHTVIVERMEAELATCEYDTTRLRIISVGEKDVPVGPTVFKLMVEQLLGGWAQNLPSLVSGGAEWPKPRCMHLDFSVGGLILDPTKAAMGPDCKYLMYWACPSAMLPAYFHEYDWSALAAGIYADEERRAGRSMDEIGVQVTLAWNGSDKANGTVVKYPGIPDMYDYERLSYAIGPPVMNWPLFPIAYKLATASDGFICASGTFYEPISVPYLREFYQSRKQEIFSVGLLTHERYFADHPNPLLITNERIKTFLDDALSKHGTDSVLYISFGTLFFPVATPGHVEALIDTLLSLEQPFPFVFALGGAMASLPEDTKNRVNGSGKGLICDFWVEQRAILQHPAVGCFLTHGGFNSIAEAILTGIPLIIWPAGAEQPITAAYLSAEPNPVAVELLQIRTGAQLGPSLRHPGVEISGTVEDAVKEFEVVLRDVRGEKGRRLRSNMIELGKKAREARARGQVKEDIKRLAKFGL